jgi:hypothetical protein
MVASTFQFITKCTTAYQELVAVAVAVSMLGGLVNERNAGAFKFNQPCSQSKPHFRVS